MLRSVVRSGITHLVAIAMAPKWKKHIASRQHPTPQSSTPQTPIVKMSAPQMPTDHVSIPQTSTAPTPVQRIPTKSTVLQPIVSTSGIQIPNQATPISGVSGPSIPATANPGPLNLATKIPIDNVPCSFSFRDQGFVGHIINEGTNIYRKKDGRLTKEQLIALMMNEQAQDRHYGRLYWSKPEPGNKTGPTLFYDPAKWSDKRKRNFLGQSHMKRLGRCTSALPYHAFLHIILLLILNCA